MISINNYTADIPADVDRSWFYFLYHTSQPFLLVQRATISGLVGSLLEFNTDGLDFVMTAMFYSYLPGTMAERKTPHPASGSALGQVSGCPADLRRR